MFQQGGQEAMLLVSKLPLPYCPPFQRPDGPALSVSPSQLLSKDGSAFELIC